MNEKEEKKKKKETKRIVERRCNERPKERTKYVKPKETKRKAEMQG